MNPLTLLQLLGPILKQLPRQARQELMGALKTGARADSNAFRMVERGSGTGRRAVRDPGSMFGRSFDSNMKEMEILDMLREDFGGSYDPDSLDDARDILQNVMRRRPIYRRR